MVSIMTLTYTLFFTFVGIISGVIIYKVWVSSFSYKFRIRRLTASDTKVTRDTLAKIKHDKQKIPYFYVWFGLKSLLKKPLPNKAAIPPAEVTEYDSTANKLVVEAWYDDNIGYTYIKDPMNIKVLEEKKGQEGFRPFPTGHREMFVNQLYKRDAAKPKTVGEILVYMTPFITLVMILTIFLIFYGKAIEPITSASQSTADNIIEMQRLQTESTEILNNFLRNIDSYEKGKPLERVIVSPELEGSG